MAIQILPVDPADKILGSDNLLFSKDGNPRDKLVVSKERFSEEQDCLLSIRKLFLMKLKAIGGSYWRLKKEMVEIQDRNSRQKLIFFFTMQYTNGIVLSIVLN